MQARLKELGNWQVWCTGAWQLWTSFWWNACYLDQQLLVPLLLLPGQIATIIYSVFIQPLENIIEINWFYLLILIASSPYVLIISASWYTRQSFYGGRQSHRCNNLRLRQLLAYQQLGGVRHALPQLQFLPPDIESHGHYNEFSIDSKHINEYLSTFNVLEHYQSTTKIIRRTLPSHYRQLSAKDSVYKRILLKAQGLQTALQSYKESVSLNEPAIYMSSEPKELPIVIDTGASCSVTPLIHDFVNDSTVPHNNV